MPRIRVAAHAGGRPVVRTRERCGLRGSEEGIAESHLPGDPELSAGREIGVVKWPRGSAVPASRALMRSWGSRGLGIRRGSSSGALLLSTWRKRQEIFDG